MIITKKFKFDAAHNLLNYHGKCEKLHGHTFRLDVSYEGKPGSDGMIVDFKILKKIVKEKVIDKLDHTYINDLLEQSTSENLIMWIWKQLENSVEGVKLFELKLYETEDSCITYNGD